MADGIFGSSGGSKLKQQDLSKLNINELNPLSPEVISRQATINIGTPLGHCFGTEAITQC